MSSPAYIEVIVLNYGGSGERRCNVAGFEDLLPVKSVVEK